MLLPAKNERLCSGRSREFPLADDAAGLAGQNVGPLLQNRSQGVFHVRYTVHNVLLRDGVSTFFLSSHIGLFLSPVFLSWCLWVGQRLGPRPMMMFMTLS
jgi:hypothetical protein